MAAAVVASRIGVTAVDGQSMADELLTSLAGRVARVDVVAVDPHGEAVALCVELLRTSSS